MCERSSRLTPGIFSIKILSSFHSVACCLQSTAVLRLCRFKTFVFSFLECCKRLTLKFSSVIKVLADIVWLPLFLGFFFLITLHAKLHAKYICQYFLQCSTTINFFFKNICGHYFEIHPVNFRVHRDKKNISQFSLAFKVFPQDA